MELTENQINEVSSWMKQKGYHNGSKAFKKAFLPIKSELNIVSITIEGVGEIPNKIVIDNADVIEGIMKDLISPFNPNAKSIPMQAVCQDKNAENDEAVFSKEYMNSIIENVKNKKESIYFSFVKFPADDKGEYKTIANFDWGNRRENEIKIGDRVKLKGDSNSPEMTVIGISSQDARYQYAAIGKGVQENTIQNDDILKCAYFVTEEDDETIAKPMQTVEIHKDALKKIITTQPSNKQ